VIKMLSTGANTVSTSTVKYDYYYSFRISLRLSAFVTVPPVR